MPLKNTRASGLQIAFLVFAVLLLAVPADRYFFSRWEWAARLEIPIGRIMIFILTGIVFLAVPGLRRECAHLLQVPIPRNKLPEIALAAALNLATGMAAFGALALLWAWSGGQVEVARHFSATSEIIQIEKALSIGGIVTSLVAAGLLAPVIEELVFRGMLFRAWERDWGWLRAAIASSFVFAFVHPAVYISQFVAGLIFVCLYRRTGSLRAAIVMHAIYNVSLWYPLAGRFVLPAGRESGRLDVWMPNLVCLGLTLVAVPIYVWMSRDAALDGARRAATEQAAVRA